MKKSQLILLFVFLSVTSNTVHALSQCKCTPSNSAFPGSNATPPTTLQISTDDEMVGATNVGKLVAVGSTTILQQIFTVQQQSSGGLNQNCPTGYVPLTQTDLQAIVARSDFSTLVGSSYLNLNFATTTYYSSTKVNPSITDGSNGSAYIYYTLSVDSKNNPTVGQANTFFDKNTKSTLCKKDYSNFAISLNGYEGFDLEKGVTYQMKITTNNVAAYYIQDNNGNSFTTQTFSYTHNGDSTWGCGTLNFKLQLFGGVIVGDCLAIWTQNVYAFNAPSSIQINQIQGSVLTGVKANVNTGFFFSPGSAPIAPIANDSSSFYVYYAVQSTSQLMVQKVSNLGVPIGSAIDTKQAGQPFDIVSTNFGFVVMARDSTQRAWIQAFNKDGTQRWMRILMNNGDTPNNPTDQIEFFSDASCSFPFGMACMYNPHNGRLNYARGKIQAIWAHYNHFGFTSTGSRNDHTGDTMISLDADTGYNQNIFWSWATSHSLYQSFIYDGKLLYVASLGDAYPQSINFQVCNIDTYQCKSSSTVVQGTIPGSGTGSSSGRTGGFINVVGNREQKYFVYQRKACDGGVSGVANNSSVNELAVVKFDSSLNYISTSTIISDTTAQQVNSIKAVGYGKNILIAYTMIPSGSVANYNPQSTNSATDLGYLTLLSGADCSVILAASQLTTFQINSSDDWRVLQNGSIAYTYVDSTNKLNIYYTPALTIPSYPNPILTSDTTYGFGSFTNTKAAATVNNYNSVCVKQGDSNWSTVDFPNSSSGSNGSTNSGSNNSGSTNSGNGNGTNNTGNSSGTNGQNSNSTKTSGSSLCVVLVGILLAILI